MPKHAQERTQQNIASVDAITILHSRTSAILAALSMAFDSPDGLPKSTVQEVLESTQALLVTAQAELSTLAGRVI